MGREEKEGKGKEGEGREGENLPRPRQRLSTTQPLIKNMPQVLHRRGDDPGPTCGADDEVEGVVSEVFDDGRGDGGERAFSWTDEVGGGGDVAECVGGLFGGF